MTEEIKFSGNEYALLHQIHMREPITSNDLLLVIAKGRVAIAESTVYQTLKELRKAEYIEKVSFPDPSEPTKSVKAYRTTPKGQEKLERMTKVA